MKFIDSIKVKLANRKIAGLLKKSTSRKVKTSNLNEAENVGLTYYVKNQDDYNKINKLLNYLKGEFGIRKIKALVYFPSKEDPDFLQSKVALDYFTKNEVSFTLQPISNDVTNFINEPFDILIDLTANEFHPLKYITLQSNAHLKIGRHKPENEPFYDLMIAEEKDDDFESYVNHIVKYLSLLKNA